MPALSDLNWNIVRATSPILRLEANPGLPDVRKKLDLIAQALRQHNLLDNAAVVNVATRLGLNIGVATWAILTPPVERNNRYEADISQDFLVNGQYYAGFERKVTIHCSLRHLKDNYYIAYNDATAPGAVLNTIAYCSTADFEAGMAEFAQKICDRLNAPVAPGAFLYSTLPVYVPTVGPRFESDSGAGTSCHSYAVATPGSAVTLNAADHASFKIVLRGVYSPEYGAAAKNQARTEWARISALPDIQAIVPHYERAMFDKALA